MKRLAITLSIIILLVMFSPHFTIFAQPAHIPHENPATARDSIDVASLVFIYGNVLGLTAEGQYQDAQSIIDDLESTNMPDEIRYITDRCERLSQKLVTTMDNLDSMLDAATISLTHFHLSEAESKLDVAEIIINDVPFLLADMQEVVDTIGDAAGGFVTLAGDRVTQANDRLGETLEQLQSSTDRFAQLQQRLTEQYGAQVRGEITRTKLSMSVFPTSVFVGDTITVSGRLIGGDTPLANRALTILLDNEPRVITTDLNGSYTVYVVSLKHVPAVTVGAVYTPVDNDIGVHLGAYSPSVEVNTIYYSTLLEASALETAHPGLPITISGQISSIGGTMDRTIKVLLDDTPFAEEIVSDQFSFEITIPPQISTGEHSLTITAAHQGRYTGVSKSIPITVSTIPIKVDIRVPSFSVTPKPNQVSGKVYHDHDPIRDAEVSLTFRDSLVTVRTAADGSFTATVKPSYLSIATAETPLELSLIGPQSLTIAVVPVESWYTPLQIEKQIFMINPVNMGLMLLAFIALGLPLYSWVRARSASPRRKTVIPEAEFRESLTVTPSRPKYESTGIKGKVLSAYLNGLETVEEVTGIPMAPHITLREFLNTTIPRLPAATKSFTELTLMAETALYSVQELDENTATRAERLVGIIKEELHSEAT